VYFVKRKIKFWANLLLKNHFFVIIFTKEPSLPEIDPAVNNRIIEVRKALKLSQKDFSAGIKISRSLICALEASQRRVNDRIVKIICLTYGVNEQWLKTGSGILFTDLEDLRLKRILENFKKLDEFLQEYVLKQIDMVLEIQERIDGK
jgi:transcriptional regulator with XRE-family HTH domain